MYHLQFLENTKAYHAPRPLHMPSISQEHSPLITSLLTHFIKIERKKGRKKERKEREISFLKTQCNYHVLYEPASPTATRHNLLLPSQ